MRSISCPVDSWLYGQGGFIKLLALIENNGEPAPTRPWII